MSNWRKALLDDVLVGLLAAIPVLRIARGEHAETEGFFAYWPQNGQSVEVFIPPGVCSPKQLPTAEQAIMQAVEALMLRAPIAGRA